MTWTKIIILLNTEDFSSVWLIDYSGYDTPSGKVEFGDNLNVSLLFNDSNTNYCLLVCDDVNSGYIKKHSEESATFDHGVSYYQSVNAGFSQQWELKDYHLLEHDATYFGNWIEMLWSNMTPTQNVILWYTHSYKTHMMQPTSANGFPPIEQIINVTWFLMVNLENWP
jgi:hypothetical protein